MTAAPEITVAETDRAELVEYLTNLNHTAKRQFPTVGNSKHETEWDRAHRRMDGPLDDMLRLGRS